MAIKHEGALLYCLKQIMDGLPQNRDWLDPDIESLAKKLIKESENVLDRNTIEE